MSDLVRLNMDKTKFTGMVVLDLQKAFDTVNHDILLAKLDSIGLSEETTIWFKSYLCGREQFVEIDRSQSSLNHVTCGVPQGSILGPLLFLIYVNDMETSISSKCQLLLYADDSVIVYSSDCVDEINKVLSEEMDKMYAWLTDNKLSLHLGKTEAILFGTNKKLQSVHDFNVKCQGKSLQVCHNMKYLGVIFDETLCGKSMANSVLGKIGKGLKILHRKTQYFNFEERKMVAMALLQSHFDYGCQMWYRGLTKYLKKKLQCAQNKMIRYIIGADSRFHLSFEHFKKLNSLSVNNRVEYLTLTSMFNVHSKSAPEYMIKLFSNTVHCHNTRFQRGYCLPCVKSSGYNSFCFNAVKMWNNLPFEIPSTKSMFKTKCKNYLLSVMKKEQDDIFVH